MREALDLAARGEGAVEPNPMVGCVLVHGDEVIGQGYHTAYGEAHAERAAIADAHGRGNQQLLDGATAYVTLEPCCHHGKTPPCTEALLEARVARVVCATLDPFPAVAGKGCEQLRRAGILVQVGLLEEQAQALNAPYNKRIEHSRPWVIAKWAMTLDGKIATRAGHSQWISCAESRAEVHRLRSRVDAIIVGSGTALADDPRLTTRTNTTPRRVSTRVVVDSKVQLPTASQLAQSTQIQPVLVWAGPDGDAEQTQRLRDLGVEVELSPEPDANRRLDDLLGYLARQKNATNVLVEGGGKLLGSLLELGQIDECHVFVAPKLVGGREAPSPIGGLGSELVDQGLAFETLEVKTCGPDLRIRCWRRR